MNREDFRMETVERRLIKETSILVQLGFNLKGKIIVDLGCGEAELADVCIRNHAKAYIGVDMNSSGGCRLLERFPSEAPVHFMVGDVKHPPLRVGAMDIIFLCELLEHLNDPRVALDEANYLLPKNGHLVVDVPWLHEIYKPLSAVGLRTLMKLKKGEQPFLLKIIFKWVYQQDSQGIPLIRYRSLGRFVKALTRLYPPFKIAAHSDPEAFLRAYCRNELPEGDLHLQFYLPPEWKALVERAHFRILRISGAFMTPPIVNRIRLINRIFRRLETSLNDRLLCFFSQYLIIVAMK